MMKDDAARMCRRCHEGFPLTTEHFYMIGGKYPDSCCKVCRSFLNNEAKRLRVIEGRVGKGRIKVTKAQAKDAFVPNEPTVAAALRNLTPLERAWKGERP